VLLCSSLITEKLPDAKGDRFQSTMYWRYLHCIYSSILCCCD